MLSLLWGLSSKSGATSPTFSVDVLSAVDVRPFTTAMRAAFALGERYPAVAAVCWSATISVLARLGPVSSIAAFRRAATGFATAI